MWRAYLASFVLNLPHTNALIREIATNPGLRAVCGLKQLPHRSTFNRFVQRLSHHADLVESCFAALTEQLREALPDLGEVVAVDSTVVRSHSSPHRGSDPEASWTAKNHAGAHDAGKEWRYGYKLHMVADATHGLPLGMLVTTAKRNDSPELPTVMRRAEALYGWFRPAVAIADRGYDSNANHQFLYDRGALAVIHIKKPKNTDLYGGIYTKLGIPTCMGGVEMVFVRTDPETGQRLYRCGGCHREGQRSERMRQPWRCDSETWENPKTNLRLFGMVRRDSQEWQHYYRQRWAIERLFKTLKESCRLERHTLRGLRRINLHVLMATLAFQVSALAHLQAGERQQLRWMVRRVA